MQERRIDPADVLEVLACEIDARPHGAPGPDALVAHVRAVRRDGSAVIVTFDASAREAVEAFAAKLHDLDIDIKDLQKVFGRDGSTCQQPVPPPPAPPTVPFG
jgi:hypothetical protein